MLRDALVRAVSQILAQYVDGITAEQAQFNIRDGLLELSGARLRGGVVPPQLPLQLVRGEIGLSICIPWRSLGQEPVVIKVSNLDVELEPAGAPASQEDREALCHRWREARAAAVEAKARALAAADATQKTAPILARLTKRVLQNLEIHVVRSRVLLRDTDELVLGASLVLQTANADHGDMRGQPKPIADNPPNRTSTQPAPSGMFFKSFELKDVAVHLNRTCLLGPLSLRTRLSDVDSNVRLSMELVNTSFSGSLAQLPRLVGMAGRLSRIAKMRSKIFPKLRRIQQREPIEADDNSDDSPPTRPSSPNAGGVGGADSEEEGSDGEGSEDMQQEEEEMEREMDQDEKEFTELLLEKLQGRMLNEVQVKRLQEIEDTTTVAWRAWHLHACEKQLAEKKPERWGWLSSPFRASSSTAGARPESDRDAVLQDIRGLLRDLPEDEAPQTIEISVCVPTLDVLFKDDHCGEAMAIGSVRGDLRADARGLEVRVRVKPQGANRELTLSAELISAHLRFADTPLIFLDNVLDDAATDEDGFADLPDAAVELNVKVREEADSGWLVEADLLAPPGGRTAGGGSSDSCRSPGVASVDTRWPFEVHLAPWSIRRFLELFLAAAQAYHQRQPRFLGRRSTLPTSPSKTPRARFLTTFSIPGSTRADQQRQPQWPSAALEAAREKLPTVRLAVNLCVAAPVLHWELPSGDVASVRLGQLHAQTVGQHHKQGWDFKAEPRAMPLAELGLAAELTHMCVTIFHRQQSHYRPGPVAGRALGSHYAIFEESTITARLTTEQGIRHARLEAPTVRMRVGSEVWRFLGQLQPTLDWALEPLEKEEHGPGRTERRDSQGVAAQRSMDALPILVKRTSSGDTAAVADGRPLLLPGVGRPGSAPAQDYANEGASLQVVPSAHSPFRRGFSDGAQAASPSHLAAAPAALPRTLQASTGQREYTGRLSAERGDAAAGGAGQTQAADSGEEALRAFLGADAAGVHMQRVPSAAAGDTGGSGFGRREPSKRRPRAPSLDSEIRSSPRSEPAEGPPPLLVTAHVLGFELLWGNDEEGASLSLEQLSLRRCGAEATAEVVSLELKVRVQRAAVPLLTLQEGGELSGGATGGRPWVKLRSRPIAVDWHPECAATILRMVRATQGAWQEGQRRVEQQLFIHEGGRGAIAESWRRWRETHVKGLRRRLLKRWRRMRRQAQDPTLDLLDLEPPQEGLPVEDRLPCVEEGEELSLEAAVFLERLSLRFWRRAGSAGGGETEASPCMNAGLRGVRLSARLFKSWTVRGCAALEGFEVHMHRRRLLAPRIRTAGAPSHDSSPDGVGGSRGGRFTAGAASGRSSSLSPRKLGGMRSADLSAGPAEQLLEIGFFIGARTLIAANGAQLSLLYRQRDVDFLLAYFHAQVLDVLVDFKDVDPPSSKRRGATRGGPCGLGGAAAGVEDRARPEPQSSRGLAGSTAQQPDATKEAAASPAGPPQVLYSLDVGCPVLFIPVFKDVLHDPIGAHDVTKGGELGPSGDIQGTEDTYSMVDFGHLQIWNRCAQDEPTDTFVPAIELRFRGTVVKSNAGGRPRYVARPSSHCFTKMTVLPGGRRVEAWSTGHYCMELLRREVTQWLDIIAENVLYRGYAPTPPPEWPVSERKRIRDERLQQAARQASSAIQNKGFTLDWRWEALDIDTSFTEAAPLSHIELCMGHWRLQAGGGLGLVLDLEARSLALLDRRPGSRNADRAFIRCGPPASAGGGGTGGMASSSPALFQAPGTATSLSSTSEQSHLTKLRMDSQDDLGAPSFLVKYAQKKATVRIRDPVTLVLPQMYLDQQSWGLSCWRLCSWRLHPRRALPPQLVNGPPPQQGVSIEVSVEHGAFRILTQFEDRGAEHLEIRGNLLIKVSLGERMQLDVSLSDGRVHRSLSDTLVCPAARIIFKSRIHNQRTETGGVHSDFNFNVEVPPLRMQLTGLDLGILTRGIAELARRDAESVEPREEVELRDPDAMNQRADRVLQLSGTFGFQGLDVLFADDRRGAQPALKVAARCPKMTLDLSSQRGKPSTWSFKCPKETLGLEVSSFHARLGVWEPVLSGWRVTLTFGQVPVELPGRSALKRELAVASDTTLTAVVTTAFVRLVSWFVPLFLAHLKSKDPDESGFESPLCMLNLSGVPCIVACGPIRLCVDPGPSAHPLDELLRPGESPAAVRYAERGAADELFDALGSTGQVSECESDLVEVTAQGWPVLRTQLAREALAFVGKKLVCEVLVPHPSRRLLLLSSAAHVENCTQLTLQISFLDDKGNFVEMSAVDPISVSAVRRHFRNRAVQSRGQVPPEQHMSPSKESPQRLPVLSEEQKKPFRDAANGGRATSACLGPGQLLFAPFDAVLGTPTRPYLRMQVRPFEGEHEWSRPQAVGVGYTKPGCPAEFALEGLDRRRQTLFVEVVEHQKHSDMTTLQLAMWTRSLANACPCMLQYRLRDRDGRIQEVQSHEECAILVQASEFQVRLGSVDAQFTEWSSWLRWEAKAELEEFEVHIRWPGASCGSVALTLKREPERRRVIVYAPFWFVDATGLGARLYVRGHLAVLFPMDGKSLCLLPAIIKPGAGSCMVELALEGQLPVKLRVPPLGAPEAVRLPPHREAVLRTERIAAAETFGVHCRLVSLLPRYVLFNRTRTLTLSFWQEGHAAKAAAIAPGCNDSFFFEPTGRQRLVFAPVPPATAARQSQSRQADGEQGGSPSFELADHTIGVYPIATKCGPLCLKISREGGVLTATVDEDGCHEVRNEHKSLIVEVRPDASLKAAVVAKPGDVRAFGSWNPFEHGHTAEVHLTRLGGEPRGGSQLERMQVDLRRRDRLELRVGGLPVTVMVTTVKRVAVITVRPRAWQEALVERVDCSITLKTIGFAFIGETPRCERFGMRLDAVELLVGQEKDEDMRSFSLAVSKLQVDRFHPTPDVLLASVRGPFLKSRILREDCNSSHVQLSSGELTVGELEAAIDDETVKQLSGFVSEAMPEPPGLHLHQVRRRATSPYPESCNGPPDLPPTLALRSLIVSSSRVRIWARLSMENHFLPRSLVWFARITGLGVRVLQLDGVVLSVPQLRFFQYACVFGRPDPPFVGSARGLLGRIAERYLPELAKCWQSVVSNSNIIFGGLLSRQFWLPKNRQVSETHSLPRCTIGSQGQVEGCG